MHEALIELVRKRPELVADLLRGPLGIDVPTFEAAQLSASELNDVSPTEYRADAVVTLTVAGKPVLAVVVEVQLRPDHHKRRTWPAYVATLYARSGCPALLLVLSPDPRVANWCAQPIFIGRPGLVLTPVVLGSPKIPVVTDSSVARRAPEMAVLSALAHSGSEERTEVFGALLAALDSLEPKMANLYTDLILAALPAAARRLRLTVGSTHTFHPCVRSQ